MQIADYNNTIKIKKFDINDTYYVIGRNDESKTIVNKLNVVGQKHF